MANPAVGQPLEGVGQPRSFASLLKPNALPTKMIPMKPVSYLHGEPIIQWDQSEVDQIVVNENLQFALIGKFSYGWPKISDLRRLIPKYCELKGEYNVGLLSNMHVLIRASVMEDYVHLLSKSSFYITHLGRSYPMRTLKWDPKFHPERRRQ